MNSEQTDSYAWSVLKLDICEFSFRQGRSNRAQNNNHVSDIHTPAKAGNTKLELSVA